MEDENAVDSLIHELLAAVHTSRLNKVSIERDAPIAPHTRRCPECRTRYDEVLKARLQRVDPANRAMITSVACLSVGELREEANESRYLDDARADALAQDRPKAMSIEGALSSLTNGGF